MREHVLMIDRLYDGGGLGAEPRAGRIEPLRGTRRHQAGIAFAELHHRVHPSAGVSHYGPRRAGRRQEMTDTEADWDRHFKEALWVMTAAQARLVCDVCARGKMPAQAEIETLCAGLDRLADHWGLG